MHLDDWRKQEDLSLDQLATKLGIEGANPGRTVQRYIRAERAPDIQMMRKIHELTEGLVTYEDWPSTRRSTQDAA